MILLRVLKVHLSGCVPHGCSEMTAPFAATSSQQLRRSSRIGDVGPSGHHGDGCAAGVECGAVGCLVAADGSSGHDDVAGARGPARELGGRLEPVGRGFPRAHHAQSRPKCRLIAQPVDGVGRVRGAGQEFRVVGVTEREFESRRVRMELIAVAPPVR